MYRTLMELMYEDRIEGLKQNLRKKGQVRRREEKEFAQSVKKLGTLEALRQKDPRKDPREQHKDPRVRFRDPRADQKDPRNQ